MTRAGQPVVLSFSQESLWFLEQLDRGTARHHVHSAWTLRGDLDVEALRQALRLVGERHSALRTIFVERGGRPRGVVLEEGPELLECGGEEMDVVRREEFEAVKAMAEKARAENERLEARIAELEQQLAQSRTA